jgi:hypothetical protein
MKHIAAFGVLAKAVSAHAQARRGNSALPKPISGQELANVEADADQIRAELAQRLNAARADGSGHSNGHAKSLILPTRSAFTSPPNSDTCAVQPRAGRRPLHEPEKDQAHGQ